MGKRCIVIGLDGASPIVLEWAKEGKLPNIAKLMEDGISGELASTIPFFSAVAWASFLTGKNPGKTGIFGWTKRIMGTYDTRSVNSNDLYPASPLWKLLEDASQKGIFVGIPMTSPPHKIDGVIIGGLPAHEIKAYPLEVDAKIKEFGFDVVAKKEESMEDFYQLNSKQAKVVFYLLENYEWTFFIVNFQAHQHWFQHGMVLEQCQDLDQIVGQIADKLDRDTSIIIMSDHGTMPVYKDVNIGNLLQKLKLLKLKETSTKPSKKLLSEFGITRNKISRILNKATFGHVPRNSLAYRMVQKGLGALPSMVSSKSLQVADVDWSQTKAFSLEPDGIFINLKKREAEGIIARGSEYEKLRDYIISELLELKDPDNGTRVIKEVYRKEEIYKGLYADLAPDLLIVSSYGYRLSIGNLDGEVISKTRRKTYQERDGILIIKGADIQRGKEIEKTDIIDLAPTILHILGEPIPRDVDGRVLKEIFSKQSEFGRQPITYRETDGKSKIQQKVKELKLRGEI